MQRYFLPPMAVDALVFFERGGMLFEVHASHCSCYDLEGQWEPEETTREAIAMRPSIADPEMHGEEASAAVYIALRLTPKKEG